MEPEDRIDRMQAAGVITPEQAAMLRASLERRTPARPRSRPGAHAWYLSAALVAALAMLVLAGALSSGDGALVQDVAESMNQPGGSAMNKGVSSLVAVVLLLVVPLLIWSWLHNDLVSKEEATYAAWAQVESNYQRRADLIPALVETVSRYLRHESDTLTRVVGERGEGLERFQKTVDGLLAAQRESTEQMAALEGRPPADESTLEAVARAQESVGARLRGLLALAEDYPELRSADHFLELQAQVEGTENRINVARMRFNEAVRAFNGATRRLPGNLVAAVGNFRRKAYFQAEDDARDAAPLGLE